MSETRCSQDFCRAWLPAALLFNLFHVSPGNAQETPDVGVTTEALRIGVEIDGSCDYSQASAALDAWKYLVVEIRGNEDLSRNVFNCLLDAHYVEVGCDTVANFKTMSAAILQDEYQWKFECIDFPPGVDKDGNPTWTLADARVSIEGARMRLDKSYLSSGSKEAIAATMAHELMHNRGYRHEVNDYGSPLYSLTAPEQAEACVRNAAGGGATTFGQNPDPYADFWDRHICCYGPGYRFWDSRNYYTMTSDRLFQLDDGTVLQPGDSTYLDAAMCL